MVDRDVVAWLCVGAAMVAGGTALRFAEPWLAGLPSCAFREIFHVGCMTCGFSRAMVRLAQGDLAASWALHPLAIAVTLEAVLGWFAWGVGRWPGRPRVPRRAWMAAAAITAAGALLVWVIRLVLGIVPA
jgi:hypothetical protein